VRPAGPTVVLADDNAVSLATWKNLLQETCKVVATAADGPSALDAILQFKPDVAVLDINMPGLSGLDVARTAITEQPTAGIVLCSVMREPEIIQAAVDAGVRGYVFKVNVFPDLANAVAAVAGGGRFIPLLDPAPFLEAGSEAAAVVSQDVDAPDLNQMLQALRESEKRLRLALEANSEGVWDWNIQSGQAYFSDCYARMLGYESEEFPTDYAEWKQLVHPADFDRVHQAHADHIYGGKEFLVEFRMRKKTGDWCWIRSRAAVIERDAAGTAIRMVGTHLDITERKRMEEELRKSEEKFSKAFMESPMALTITSTRDHRYLEVNEAFEIATEYSREQILGRTPFELKLWVDPEQRKQLVDRVRVEGHVRDVDIEYRTKAGEIRDALGSAALVEINNEPCMLSVIIDVTHRKQAERALRDTEQRLQSALQTSEERLRFETLLAEISGRFVNRTGNQIDEEIENSLESICRSLGIDHSSIYQVTDNPEILVKTHLFRDVALPQPPELFEAGKFFPWCLKKLMAGEIVNLPSTRNAPAEAVIDRQIWETYQIRSTLAIPMVTGGGKLVGIWGFDSIAQERDWPEPLQKQLKLLAEALANAIDRRITEERLAEREVELREAQRVARIGSWTQDRNDVLKWSDEMYRIHGRDARLGPPTFEELQHLFAPESWEFLKTTRKRAWESGSVRSEDLEIVHPDGSRGWIATRGEVECDGNGRIVRIRGTAQDITERKQAEQKLREYERAIEGVEEMIVVVDREYRFVIANHPFLNFYKKAADQVIGHSISEIVDKEIFENAIKKNLEKSFGGQPAGFEVTFTSPELGARTVFATHLPIDGPHGVERVVAILQDITERKKAEKGLLESESALREAQRIARIGSWTWDPKTDAITWSAETCELLRWDVNLPTPPFREHEQFFVPESWRRLKYTAEETSRTGEPYEVETEVVLPNGSRGWFIVRGEAVYGPGGEIDHLRGTFQDRTERHLAEAALRESEERFRSIADTAPVMIWMTGPDNRTSYVNKQWLEFTGTTFESHLGDGRAEGIDPEDAGRVTQEYNEAFARRAAVTLHYRLKRHDGEYRWVIDTAVPRFDPDGSFAGYIGSCVDDTERRKGEAAIRGIGGRLIQAQEQERKRIARELHDDINQRLAMLAIQLQQLQAAAGLTPTQIGGQLEKLFQETIDISSGVQALSHQLHSASLEHLGLAGAIKGFCYELARHHNVAIDYEHHGVPRSLSPDISLALFRITQEALQNAIKYSGVREFSVRLLGSADRVLLKVRDEGVGFGLEGAMHGRGLGLISMRERMVALHGTLSVVSKPKQGTEITASVPLLSPA